MAFLSGLLGGINTAAAEGRKLRLEQDQKQYERETSMLTELAKADNAEIADAAISALTEIASGAKRPKGGYFERLVGGGPDTVHPAVAGVLKLVRTPARPATEGGAPTAGQPAGTSGGAPSALAPPRPSAPPSVAPAAQPPTAMTQPGGGPAAQEPIPPVAPQPGVAAGEGPASMPQTRVATPPPSVNTPPQANRAAVMTSAPTGPSTAAPAGGAGPMGVGPTAPPSVAAPPASPMGSPLPGGLSFAGAPPPAVAPPPPNFRERVNLTPLERQRATNQLHVEMGAMQKEAEVATIIKVGTAQGWSPQEISTAIKRAFGATSGVLREGNVHETFPGSGVYVQDLWDPTTGAVFTNIPASKPAAVATAEAAATRVTNDRDAVSLELYGKKFGLLDQPAQARVNATLDRRAVNLAGAKAEQVTGIATAARDDRTTGVTVMFPDGSFGRAKETQQGDLVTEDGNTLPPNVLKVTTAAAIPPKIDVQGKSILIGLDVMRSTNSRLKKAIEAAGLQNDNNPIPIKWDQWLYQHGIDPGDMAKGLPFSEYAQLGGTSEAYGLRGLIGGRPNQTLIDIYGAHLAQPGNTPQLMYKKLTELDNIMTDVEAAVLKAQGTKIRPDVRGAGGEGGATTALPANYDGIREQAGYLYHVKTDKDGKVISAELKGPATKKPGGGGETP